MATDGIVHFALDQKKLAIGASGVAGGIIHFIEREFLREAKIDERDKRFLVPGLQNLLRRKRNQCGVVFAAQDEGFCDRAFGKNGIGVGKE